MAEGMESNESQPENVRDRSVKDDTARDDRAAARADLLRVWLPVALLAVVAFGYTIGKLEPAAPDSLTLASGGEDGAYYAFGQAYVERLAEEGLELKVVPTAGAVENLELLAAGEVDLALLQGGVVHDRRARDAASDATTETVSDDLFEAPVDTSQLVSLGSLFFEPVWLFYRADGESPLERLTELAGRRVAIGPAGSGTQALARQMLEDNGLELREVWSLDAQQSDVAVHVVELPSMEAAEALLTDEIDAAVFVASASASYVRRLLSRPGIELMSFRRHRAYSHLHPYLSQVILGEGMLDLRTNLPDREVTLVAAAASLAAHEDLHHALVPLLVRTLEEVHGPGGLFEEPGDFPSARFAELEVDSEADHYLENGPSFLYRILPYRTAASVDRLKILLLPFIPLLLVAFKMAPPIYRWRIRSKIYRWYEDLRRIDRFLLDESDPGRVDEHLDLVRRMERELTEEVSVPLSYMDEFYDLRMHVRLIQGKLDDLKQRDTQEP